MTAHRPKALFLVAAVLSSFLAACFGGHGGGGGGGGNGGGGGGNGGGGSNNSPIFAIAVADSGNFQQGQKNATYTIDVTNVGKVTTSGNVEVDVTLPVGESLVSISGSGWTFSGGSLATRADSLAPGASWPILTITVNVSLYATSPQVLMASVSGGGAATADSQDSTAILTRVSILLGRYAFLFSGFDANGAVAIAGSINVDVNGNVTGKEDFKDPSVVQPGQQVVGFCQNLAIASAGFCKLTAGGRTSQYDFVLRNNETVARFFEDPADGADVGSGLLISQVVPSSTALTSAGGFNGFFSIEFSGTDGTGARIAVEGNIFTNLSAAIASQNGFLPQADVNDNGTLIQPANSTTGNVTGNFTPLGTATVDAFGRATMTMTIGGSQTLTLALYILAPEVPTTNQSGRAFAIDITPITAVATSKQVLSGQFNWLGNAPLNLTIDSTNFPVNVFGLWGVTPGAPANSSTQLGTFNGATGQLLFDSSDGGKFNGGSPPQSGPQAGTIGFPINVAPNGRAILSVTVNGTPSNYVLYLDAVSDGNMLGATVGIANDPKVSFGFFTGQNPTSGFDNTTIKGNYVAGTTTPVLPTVPNGASPVTLTPSGQTGSGNTLTFNGSFVAGATTGTYSFLQATGRVTGLASQGTVFQNSNFVMYIITPNLMLVMGADQGQVADAIGIMQH
jgi:hypothetical protein